MMTRHDLRKWLGGRSLRSFKSKLALYKHFEPEGLVPIFGTMYTFEEMEEARALAMKVWDEVHRG